MTLEQTKRLLIGVLLGYFPNKEALDSIDEETIDKWNNENSGSNEPITNVVTNISELKDVSLTNITNNQILSWDAETQKFINIDLPNFTQETQEIDYDTISNSIYRAILETIKNSERTNLITNDDYFLITPDGYIINAIIEEDEEQETIYTQEEIENAINQTIDDLNGENNA